MIVSALSIIIPIKGAAPGGDRVASGARSRRRGPGPSVDRVGDAGVDRARRTGGWPAVEEENATATYGGPRLVAVGEVDLSHGIGVRLASMISGSVKGPRHGRLLVERMNCQMVRTAPWKFS